jgi:hypothetical protein
VGAIDRWLRLTPADKALVIRIAPVVAAASFRVRVLGVARVLAWARGPVGVKRHASPEDLARACERAGRYIPGATCLAQSAALTRLLRRTGVAADVRIGVATDPGFAAHAWVEIDGAPLTRAPGRFTPLRLN